MHQTVYMFFGCSVETRRLVTQQKFLLRFLVCKSSDELSDAARLVS